MRLGVVTLFSSSTNCLPAGSRRLLTPSPSSRSGRDTSRSRPSSQQASRSLVGAGYRVCNERVQVEFNLAITVWGEMSTVP